MDYKEKSKYIFLASYYVIEDIKDKIIESSLTAEEEMIIKNIEKDYELMMSGFNSKIINPNLSENSKDSESFNDTTDNALKGNPYRDLKTGKFAPGPSRSKPMTFKDRDVARDYINDNYQKEVVDPSDRMAVMSYTGTLYRDMNNYLRKGELRNESQDDEMSDILRDAGIPAPDNKALNKRTVEYTNRIKNLQNTTQLKDDVSLYRVPNIDRNLREGDIFIDRGFSSTSLIQSTARGFMNNSNPVKQVIKINAKKGQNGIFTNTFNPELLEQEFILPPNTTYTVKGIKKYKLYNLVEVDI